MNIQQEPTGSPLAWHVACLALLAGLAAGAQGQSVQPGETESGPPQPVPGQVLSDVEPLPAESRDSSGAVVLHDSRVRAQRDAFRAADQRTGISSAIRHNVSRVLEQVRSWDEVREADSGPAPDAQPAEPSQ